MAMAIARVHSFAILCFLLALQHYHFVLEAARVLDENQTPHGDHENRKGAIKGHPPRPDGSHTSLAPTSKPAVESTQSASRLCHRAVRPDIMWSLGSVCRAQYPRTVPSPKSPDEDPLEAYHFNCTVCD